MGIKPLPEALHTARELDLDLVEVAPQASPPVCRIMDYGRFKFEAAQRAKESRRKTTNIAVKEMKYRPKIGTADFDTKTRQVSRFLAEGHKVKITIMFRGREVYHQELGKAILDRIAEQVEGNAKMEAVPRLDGRNMTMVLAPDRRAAQAGASRSEHRHRVERGDANGTQAQAKQDPAKQDPDGQRRSEPAAVEDAATEEGANDAEDED